MEPWEPSKVAQLIAIIATGFAARWAYTTQFPPKEEEHTITIVWAAIWSGVIATIVQLFHVDLPPILTSLLPQDNPQIAKAHAAHVSAYNAAAMICNLGIFTFLGYVWGRVSVAYESAIRERKMSPASGLGAVVSCFVQTLFSRERGYGNACQFFLKKIANGEWLVVETEKGVYLGYVQVHDPREDDNFYLVLHDACMFDDVKRAFPSEAEWPAIMFRSDEVRAIAIYNPKGTTADATVMREVTEDTSVAPTAKKTLHRKPSRKQPR